ncbi:M56 family metallopeptidase [Ferruginibacter sp.]
MTLISIDNLLPGKMGQALCWMLVHSLWIGLILAVVTGIIMLATKRQTAALRYKLLTAALFVFTGTVLAVFILQLVNDSNALNNQVATSAASTVINVNDNLQAFNIVENKDSLTVSITAFLNDHANVIVLCWLLVLCFRCIKLATGLHRIKQMKTTQLTPVTDHWNEKLNSLAAALNIRTRIQFMQSGIAAIPMVAGHFKPMILFPIGLINSLPAEEVEAILLHELAHILRKDYLVNMLQNFAEVLFFFNPAVLWISALIKIERENCCDDIALSQTGSKRDYINALVSFQEYQLNAPQYATALAGNKKHLLERVKRMLYNNNKTLNAMEKTFLTVSFIVATSLTVFFTQAQTGKTKTTVIKSTAQDTFTSLADRYYNPADFEDGANISYSETRNGVKHTLYLYKRGDKLYEIFGDITSFKINGQKIPQEQWGKYKDLIIQLRQDYEKAHIAREDAITDKDAEDKRVDAENALTNKLEAEADMEKQRAEKMQAEQAAMLKLQDGLKNEQQQLLLQKAKLAAEQDAKRALQLKLEAEKNSNKKPAMEKLQLELQQLKLQQEKLQKEAEEKQILLEKIQHEKDVQQQKSDATSVSKREIERRVENDNDVAYTKLSYSEDKNAYKAYKGDVYNKQYDPAYSKDAYKLTGIQSNGNSNAADVDVKELTNNVIADLIKAKVIESPANLSYEVSNERLVVNGKVQPEDLHQELKAKYIKSPDWILLYNFRTK